MTTENKYGEDCLLPCQCGEDEFCNPDCEVQYGVIQSLDYHTNGLAIIRALEDGRTAREGQ